LSHGRSSWLRTGAAWLKASESQSELNFGFSDTRWRNWSGGGSIRRRCALLDGAKHVGGASAKRMDSNLLLLATLGWHPLLKGSRRALRLDFGGMRYVIHVSQIWTRRKCTALISFRTRSITHKRVLPPRWSPPSRLRCRPNDTAGRARSRGRRQTVGSSDVLRVRSAWHHLQFFASFMSQIRFSISTEIVMCSVVRNWLSDSILQSRFLAILARNSLLLRWSPSTSNPRMHR